MDTGNSRDRTCRSAAAMLRESAIGAAIAHLSAPLRWVMILGERNGLSTKEIANLAGVSLAAVKSMQGRGLALIQEELLMRAQRGLVKEWATVGP
jgi:DNA-directed RNA polymerase specialized sigma24 family protein